MKPILERYGVRVIALSKDSPSQMATHLRRDPLTMTLLSDPKLEAIRKYGLLHRGGFEFITVPLFGVPLGVPRGFRDMAIPTTLLVDKNGVIRWIDQAEDYRMRGDEARIEQALAATWG